VDGTLAHGAEQLVHSLSVIGGESPLGGRLEAAPLGGLEYSGHGWRGVEALHGFLAG
jgi:hypothetical protein